MLDIGTDVQFATFTDAIAVSELSRKYIEHGLRRTYTPSRIRYLIRNGDTNVVTVRKDRVLIGFGIMTYRTDSANLDLLAIEKAFRRQGIGRQLVQWLEKVAVTAGNNNIFVQVRKTNANAIGFYQTLGFQVVEEAAGYYQGRESAMIMCKGIRPMVGGIGAFDAQRFKQ